MKNYVTEFELKNLFSNRKEERSTIVIPKNELFVRKREKEKMVNENVLTNPTIVKFSRNRILRKRDFLFQKTPRSFSYTLKRQTPDLFRFPPTCKDRFPRPRRDAILPRNHFTKFLRVPATFCEREEPKVHLPLSV